MTRAEAYIKSIKGVDLLKDLIIRRNKYVSDIKVRESIKQAIYALPKRKALNDEYEKLAFRLLDVVNGAKHLKELIIEIDHIIEKLKKLNEPSLKKGIEILEKGLNAYLDELEEK